MRLNIDLSNIQSSISPHFYPLLKDNHRYIICKGGAGSSKSHSICIIILFNILKDFGKKDLHRILCLRKTSPAARRSIFELFKHYISEWNLNTICSINKGSMTIDWVNGSQILISGLDDEAKLKSIEGLTSIWLEEALELDRESFLQCDLRLRGQSVIPYRIYCSFNPVSRNSWLYKDFFAKDNPDATIHESNYKNNPWLDEKYKQHLENLIDQDFNYYRIYCENKWGSLGNLIFNNWDIVDTIPNKYTNSDAIFGADWGWIHKTSIVRVIKDGDDIFVKEEYYKDKQTHLDTINWIKEYLPDNACIYGDSAEPGRLAEARRFNINMRSAIKGPNSVKDSIDFLKRFKIHITKDSVGLIQEMESYKWRQLRDGTVEEKPVDYNDDAIAALRYAVYSHWGNKIDYNIIT